ncbi:hypothetical protein ACRR4W_005115, partial [Citrobacter freundii]
RRYSRGEGKKINTTYWVSYRLESDSYHKIWPTAATARGAFSKDPSPQEIGSVREDNGIYTHSAININNYCHICTNNHILLLKTIIWKYFPFTLIRNLLKAAQVQNKYLLTGDG